MYLYSSTRRNPQNLLLNWAAGLVQEVLYSTCLHSTMAIGVIGTHRPIIALGDAYYGTLVVGHCLYIAVLQVTLFSNSNIQCQTSIIEISLSYKVGDHLSCLLTYRVFCLAPDIHAHTSQIFPRFAFVAGKDRHTWQVPTTRPL